MKSVVLVFNLLILIANQAMASGAVQRTVESSYPAYQQYLADSKGITFVQAYIQVSSVTVVDSASVEICLEELYLGQPNRPTCFQAVKSLTVKPLNSYRREILFSLLSKLEKAKGPQQNFYQQMKKGLLWSHPELAKLFHLKLDLESEAPSNIEELELKAWKKSVEHIFPLDEVALLINGKRISHLGKWIAPRGVYQWTLVSNTHIPMTRLGTFTQFAAESLKDLKPLVEGGCNSVSDSDLKSYGIIQISIFANPKCIASFGTSASLPVRQEHLGSLPAIPPTSPEIQKNSWIIPGLAVLGVGIAMSLKGKQVSFQ